MAKKLPKKIAGVKIPKKLRKRGGKFYAVISSPVVANIIAVALIAAADALANKMPVKKAGKKAKKAAADATEAAGSGASNVIDLLAFAARESAKAIRANAKA
jgi:hypothetical protein